MSGHVRRDDSSNLFQWTEEYCTKKLHQQRFMHRLWFWKYYTHYFFFFINALVWHSEKSVTIQCRIFSSEVFLSSFLFFSSFFFFFDMFRTSVWRKRFCQKQKLKNTATLNATALHTLTRLVHCENTMAAFKNRRNRKRKGRILWPERD